MHISVGPRCIICLCFVLLHLRMHMSVYMHPSLRVCKRGICICLYEDTYTMHQATYLCMLTHRSAHTRRQCIYTCMHRKLPEYSILYAHTHVYIYMRLQTATNTYEMHKDVCIYMYTLTYLCAFSFVRLFACFFIYALSFCMQYQGSGSLPRALASSVCSAAARASASHSAV